MSSAVNASPLALSNSSMTPKIPSSPFSGRHSMLSGAIAEPLLGLRDEARIRPSGRSARPACPLAATQPGDALAQRHPNLARGGDGLRG